MANNFSSASQLSTSISATKNACTGARNYRSGHLCCDELYSSPDELLLVKWTSVFFSKFERPALGGGGIRMYQNYSKPNEMKFNHQVFLGNLLTRSTNFTVFNVLHPCRDLHIWNFFFSFLRILFSRFLPRIRRLVQNCSSTFHQKIGQ